MNELLQNLIDALREELKEYGEMLALLEHQQKLVIARQGPELLQSVATVDAQAEAIRSARHEREQRRLHLARTLQVSETAGFPELVGHLPAAYRPLLEALVQENNDLLARVQQRARQNHLLLNRAVELMQRFLQTLSAGGAPSTYNEVGRVSDSVPTLHPLCDAIG
jgi:flagellar biosynthesis/type III secretory pathway chaperone